MRADRVQGDEDLERQQGMAGKFDGKNRRESARVVFQHTDEHALDPLDGREGGVCPSWGDARSHRPDHRLDQASARHAGDDAADRQQRDAREQSLRGRAECARERAVCQQ